MDDSARCRGARCEQQWIPKAGSPWSQHRELSLVSQSNGLARHFRTASITHATIQPKPPAPALMDSLDVLCSLRSDPADPIYTQIAELTRSEWRERV